MHIVRLCTSCLLAIAPAFVLYAAVDGPGPVAPGSRWSLDPGVGCLIEASWDGDVRMELEPDFGSPGEYSLTLFSPAFETLAPDQSVDFVSDEQDDHAASVSRKSGSSYGGRVFAGLLDGLASTKSFKAYRDDVLITQLDMTGFAGALKALRNCEVTPDPGKM